MVEVNSITVEELDRDPYPIYAELREMAPAAYMPCLDVWMVTRWEGVSEAATNPDSFPAHVERSPTDSALGGVSMMTTDGEPAKQRRRPFDSSLRPRAVEAKMPDIFARLCRDQIDSMAAAGEADLVSDFFEPISLMSLAHVMGLEEHLDVQTLKRWFAGLADGVSNYEDDPSKTASCQKVSDEIDETLRPKFEELLANPDDGMLSSLINAAEGSLDERIDWAMPSLKLVILGGLQEPAHGGATIAYCLLSHLDQLAEVRSDPDLVSTAVEEGLRWTAPIGNLLRGIAPGATVEGMGLPDGERAILVVASANRDRAVFGPSADEFDINRPKRTHLSFATGSHYCIGHHFARVQLRVALTALLEAFPGMHLDPGYEASLSGHEYRSPKELRVRLA